MFRTFSISAEMAPWVERAAGWLPRPAFSLTSWTLPSRAFAIRSKSSLFSSASSFVCCFSSSLCRSRPSAVMFLNSLSSYFSSILRANSSTSSVRHRSS